MSDTRHKPGARKSTRPLKPRVNLETIKTLVAIHGQRKTAKLTGINANTILAWTKRGKWKTPRTTQRHAITTQADNASPNMKTETAIVLQSPADIVASEMEQSRKDSRLNLAKFVDQAAKDAARHPRKLAITRKAKDLADIHESLWPNESRKATFIQLGVLIGNERPRKVDGEVIDLPAGN